MICPLCEHEQAHGERCDVCGKLLTADGHSGELMVPLEGLEPTSLDPGPVPGALAFASAPVVPTCRYCGQVAGAEDVLCGRCGMKLALYRPARGGAGDRIRCGQCGGGIHEVSCPTCGARHALDDL